MSVVLVDSNVLLDIMTEDAQWYAWSAGALEEQAEDAVLAINPIIYAEVSIRFQRIEELEDALPTSVIERAALPWKRPFSQGSVSHVIAGVAGCAGLRFQTSTSGRTQPYAVGLSSRGTRGGTKPTSRRYAWWHPRIPP